MSSPLPSCFRRSTPPPPPPTDSGSPNLTTSVYKTSIGLFALTWFRNVLGRSLHIHVILAAVDGGDLSSSSSISTPSFSLNLKPLIFWNKTGFRKLNLPKTKTKSKCIQIFWDFSRVKFGGLQPEPVSGYYVAAVVDGSIAFLAGDSPAEAYSKTKSVNSSKTQSVILRREHVYGYGNKVYTTKAQFGGGTREITIDCRTGDDPRLYFSVDRKRVLEIKHLKWKFRGNERIEIDGIRVQISWDVYNWLFDDENEDGYGLFMFRFEKVGFEFDDDDEEDTRSGLVWSQQSCGFGFEKMKMRKGVLRSAATARSSSASSLSSASSSCSLVMEWASMEENELKGPSGFSLVVYAWKS